MNAQMMILLYAVLLFVVIYFMMVVPGKKKNKKMQELHDSIKVGDEVLTMGGIIATVKERDGEILTVEIDPEKEICMKIIRRNMRWNIGDGTHQNHIPNHLNMDLLILTGMALKNF